MSVQRTITLVEETEGWTAIDEATGLECSGEDRSEVLARLDDAVAISFEDDAGDGAETDDNDDQAESVFAGVGVEPDDENGSVDEWFGE